MVHEGRRILVFSQFVSMLLVIADDLNKAKIPFIKLTGASKNRGELVKLFQAGATPIFLISLKAGGFNRGYRNPRRPMVEPRHRRPSLPHRPR